MNKLDNDAMTDANRERATPLSGALLAMEDLATPLWVFDVDAMHKLWANKAALALWEADSLEELCSRDFSSDMTDAMRAVLEQYQSAALQGRVAEGWHHIYPGGHEKRAFFRGHGLKLDDGRTVMLFEASRIVENHTPQQSWIGTLPMAVGTCGKDGGFVSANSVLKNMVAGDVEGASVASVVGDKAVADALIADATARGYASVEHSLATDTGARQYRIDVAMSETGDDSFVVGFNDIESDEAQSRFLESLRQFDVITGCLNRRGLNSHGQRKLDSGEADTLMVLSVTNLEVVRSTFGDERSDETLVAIADRLRTACPNDHIVGRLADDSFAVLGKAPENLAEMQNCLISVSEAVTAPLMNGESTARPEVAIGVCQTSDDGGSISDLTNRAKFALGEAIRDPETNDNVGVYSSAMDATRSRTARLGDALRNASLEDEFHLEFQPIVDSRTLQVAKAEALLRWNSPDLGPVSPAEFIPICEQTGQIVPIGEWVIEKACEAAASLEEQLGHPVTITVNLSGLQSMQDGLAERIRNYISWVDLDPRQIEIELTESVLMTGMQSTRQLLTELNDFGVRIAIDDFGTGYSSLAYLHEFPFHSIKVDRSFIQRLPDQRSCTIVGAAVSIAESLGVSVTAEGIENEEQRKSVTELGVSHLQGFMFARSMREANFAAWASEWESRARFETEKVA